jgi:Holliday junction resolvase
LVVIEGEKIMTEEQKKENEKKGKIAEVLFSNYLNNEKIPFCHLDQKKKMKSFAFSEKKIQRPDFILFTKNDIVYADVKYRTKRQSSDSEEKRFYLKKNEIYRLSKFKTEFSRDVWLSFTDNLDTAEFKFVRLSIISDFVGKLCVDIDKYYPRYVFYTFWGKWIQIPEILLSDKLDFEKNSPKNLEPDFIKEEAEYHVRQCVSYKGNAEASVPTP